MPRKNIETITLEPITPIISFDGISYRTYITVSGAIGHYRFPSEEEYAANKKAFFSSGIGRRNKQKISEVVSEIYAYLNTRISEHGDPADYYFRLWLRVEVNKETAEIVGNPSFDIDVFRHIGKIGGKHSDIGKYLMKVVLVDKEKVPLSSIFMKGIRKAKQETELIDFTVYKSYSRAPEEIKQKITKDSYHLIIDDEVNRIEPAIDSKTKDITFLIKENSSTMEFGSEDDVFHYILKKVKISPKIIRSETGLTLVDKEIVGISRELEKAEPAPKTNLMAQLGIEEMLNELFGRLDSFKARANSEKARNKERCRANLEEVKKEFSSLKVDYEVHESELTKLEEDYAKKEITEDSYRTHRVKELKALGIVKSNLIELQKKLKEKYARDISILIGTNSKEAIRNVSTK